MRNMEKGIELFYNAINNGKNKKVFVRVDVDVDGWTSSILISNFIKYLSQDIEIVYGFNFNKEHGLTFKDLSNYTKSEFDLIIVPDASMTCKDAKQIVDNFDTPILVLDHHIIEKEYYDKKRKKWINKLEAEDIQKETPDKIIEDCYTNYCVAINDTDGVYPNSTLSGVGVVMKFCEAFCEKYNIDKKVLNQWLDLVSLGIVADNMSLKNPENRYYVLEGLKEKNQNNMFLNEIQIRKKDEFKFGRTITNSGWNIAPLINGCIRYGKKEEQIKAYEAMLGKQEDVEYQPRRKSKNDPKPPAEIHTLQWDMARVCDNVKSRQDTEVRNFMQKIEQKIEKEDLLNNSVLFVDCSDIVDKKTVTGLVANKLASKYCRPVVLLREKNTEEFGGSCRGYDKGTISSIKDFLTDCGCMVMGHNQAGGISLLKKDLDSVIDNCNKKLLLKDLCTIYPVDWEIEAKNLKKEYVLEVAENYKIWGNDIPQPTFLIKNLEINASQVMGYGDNNTFIRFVYNGITFIKKYCPSTEYNIMTLRDRNVFGINKKRLKYNIIGQFVLDKWEDKINPEVKILYYDVEEIENNQEEDENINQFNNKINIDNTKKESKLTIDDDFVF